jgi:hypothetical protein
LQFEPQARAYHDEQQNFYDVRSQADQIYTNLFDALIANPSLTKALSYECLGFAAGVKNNFRHPKTAWAYITAWYRGHRALMHDWGYLKGLMRQPLPQDKES